MAADAALEAVITKVVDDKVQARDLFTVHDVTLEVRQRGHFAKHDDVRDVVHDLYGRGSLGIDYTKTNITVPGGATPILYLPKTEQASNYNKVRGGSQNTPSTSSPGQIQVPSFGGGSTDDDDGDDDGDDSTSGATAPNGLVGSIQSLPPGWGSTIGNGKKPKPTATGVKGKGVDKRQCLLIPSVVVKGAGLLPKTKVLVCSDPSLNGTLVVTTNPASRQVLGKYTVDSHQNVRITQACLIRGGLKGSKYDVEVGSELQVTLA